MNYATLIKKKQKRFIYLYISILLICFSPFKMLGALAPYIFLFGILFYVQCQPKTHIVKYMLFVLIYFTVGLIYKMIYQNFSLINYSFYLITSSSFLILFYNYKIIVTKELIIKLTKVTSIIILIESSLGIIQATIAYFITGSFDRSAGDHVTGTLELDLFKNDGSGSNQMFSILISTSLLFLFIGKIKWTIHWKFILLISIISLILASVMHSLIFLFLAIISTILISNIFNIKNLFNSKTWVKNFQLAGIIVTFGVLISVVLPTNFNNIKFYANQIINFDQTSVSPKIVATYLSVFELSGDEPLQPYIGIGLGQYSSRASLIRSGQYLTNSSFIPAYSAFYLEKYILPLISNYIDQFGSGSTYFPFYGWMSLYGEAGFLGILIIIVLLYKVARKIILCRSIIFPNMHYGLLVLLIYIALLGFQDNYWEWSQAIFPAVLILRLGWLYLLNERQKTYG